MTTVCPVCGNSPLHDVENRLTGSVTSDHRYLPLVLPYRSCRSCGYLFRDPDDRIDRQDYYSSEYALMLGSDDAERMIFDDADVPYSEYLVSFLSGFLTDKPGASCLDIGAGKGGFAAALHREFPQMVISAVEPSRSCEILRKRGFLHRCIHGYFTPDAFTGERFDCITMIEVLEHVPDPKRFLSNVTGLMRDNAVLMVSVPNVENDKYDFLSPDHFSRFIPGSILNLFRVSGLEVVKASIPPASASMIFVLRKGHAEGIVKCNTESAVSSALELIDDAVSDADELRGIRLAVYGQGLILTYLVGQCAIREQDIACVIDDNRLFQGKRWNGSVEIVGLTKFIESRPDVREVFLAMNECYHAQVRAKLPDRCRVRGTRREKGAS